MHRTTMGSVPKVEISQAPSQAAIGLRSFQLPYADAPRTWIMDVDASTLRPVRPLHEGAICLFEASTSARRGFWNDLPDEEQREPTLQMEPAYPADRNQAVMYCGINLQEVVQFVVMTYAAIGLARLAVVAMCYIS